MFFAFGSVTSRRYYAAFPTLLALAACATNPGAPATEPEIPALEPTAVPAQVDVIAAEVTPLAAVPDKSKLRISVAAVGDMMIGTDYPKNHLPDDDGVSFLNAVTPFVASADIAFGNLEGVLVDGGEPGKTCKNLNACYLFRSPTRYAQHYRDAGFDVLSLANNHARDFGEEGRTATMQALDRVGIYHSGRAGEFASFEENGLKIALLAYAVTKGSNLMHDYDLAAQTVTEHAARHDIVIVTFHGGAEGASMMHVPFAEEEYYGEPRGDVALFARRMVDSGADLVLGHGPHVVRGMERYKDRLIAYSLGNFATYYGISVEGVKGIAPILTATLDGEGRFIDGEIASTIQLRPDGPSVDDQDRALNLIRDLSIEDFGDPKLTFHPDGRLSY
jgi:poly-gamma-glutamate capsule biosynthesis protein CapA/YwtB (metallophosphatase superfamily)